MATEMHFQFLAPVFIGETVTAQAEIVALDPDTRKVTLRCTCLNAEGKEVLRGEVVGFPGRFEGEEEDAEGR
jgi:3-hydroxybutyryl-CoA dehydratase